MRVSPARSAVTPTVESEATARQRVQLVMGAAHSGFNSGEGGTADWLPVANWLANWARAVGTGAAGTGAAGTGVEVAPLPRELLLDEGGSV